MLLSGLIFLLIASDNERPSRKDNRLLLLNSLAVLTLGIISFKYFFPVPAVCLSVAGLLGISALRKV